MVVICMSKIAKSDVSIERLREVLGYDPETGDMFWLSGGKGIRLHRRAGYVDPSTGYIKIMVDKKQQYAHRIAWSLTHGSKPNEQIDHINGCRTDNRLSNLRLATHAENCQNHQRRPINTTGFKGVVRYFDGRGGFRAQIKKDGKGMHLGVFDTAEEAHAAYCEAASRLFGKFARFR